MTETEIMELAYNYAKQRSGCVKVQVGAAITEKDFPVIYPMEFGTNVTYPVSCKEHGCRRQELYGEDSKNHRLPSDCRAIHAEIDCITKFCNSMKIARYNIMDNLCMIVTRYPCEACARAIVNTGFIKRVVYGGEQEISEETQKIFESANVEVVHINWKPEYDTDR